MSASERLKQLQRQRGVRSNDELWPALPQIVAVVEAAEAGGGYIIGSKFSMEQPFVSERIRDLRVALTALEEALS